MQIQVGARRDTRHVARAYIKRSKSRFKPSTIFIYNPSTTDSKSRIFFILKWISSRINYRWTFLYWNVLYWFLNDKNISLRFVEIENDGKMYMATWWGIKEWWRRGWKSQMREFHVTKCIYSRILSTNGCVAPRKATVANASAVSLRARCVIRR